MKKNRLILLLTFLLSIILITQSCKDIIEEDISDDNIELFSPQNGDTIEAETITFWWKELDGAINYRFELIDANGFPVRLSVQTGNQLEFPLDSLNKNQIYRWRVRAENSSYESIYTTREFFVSELINISQSRVTLTSPDDQEIIQFSPDRRFEWTAINGASKYTLQVANNKNFNPVIGTRTTTGTAILQTAIIDTTGGFATRKQYYWRVRAFNESDTTEVYGTNFSTSRTFYIEE